MTALLLTLAITFHPVTVKVLPTTPHTHVEVCGTVTLKKREDDGDWHLRIQTGSAFIVAEIIPAVPLPPPEKGATVCVSGISREDKAHGWWEVHPVLAWRPATVRRD